MGLRANLPLGQGPTFFEFPGIDWPGTWCVAVNDGHECFAPRASG